MHADLDRRRIDRDEVAEHRDMQREAGQLGGGDGFEAAVVDRRRHRRVRDGLVQAIPGLGQSRHIRAARRPRGGSG